MFQSTALLIFLSGSLASPKHRLAPLLCHPQLCTPHHTTPNRKVHFPPGVIRHRCTYGVGWRGVCAGLRNGSQGFSRFGDIGVGWMSVGFRFGRSLIQRAILSGPGQSWIGHANARGSLNPTQSWNLDRPKRPRRRSGSAHTAQQLEITCASAPFFGKTRQEKGCAQGTTLRKQHWARKSGGRAVCYTTHPLHVGRGAKQGTKAHTPTGLGTTRHTLGLTPTLRLDGWCLVRLRTRRLALACWRIVRKLCICAIPQEGAMLGSDLDAATCKTVGFMSMERAEGSQPHKYRYLPHTHPADSTDLGQHSSCGIHTRREAWYQDIIRPPWGPLFFFFS